MTNSVEDEMLEAIAALPPHLRARGDKLPFPQLHNACLDCDLDLVAALIHAGLTADMYPCTDDEDDEPPLVWMAEHYDGDSAPAKATIELLLKLGADVDEGCPLLVAAEHGNVELVDIFVELGADVDDALNDSPSPEAEALIQRAQLAMTTPKPMVDPGGLARF